MCGFAGPDGVADSPQNFNHRGSVQFLDAFHLLVLGRCSTFAASALGGKHPMVHAAHLRLRRLRKSERRLLSGSRLSCLWPDDRWLSVLARVSRLLTVRASLDRIHKMNRIFAPR